ncbi:MAG: DUF6588 family protein [Bacteroidota bacterium]
MFSVNYGKRTKAAGTLAILLLLGSSFGYSQTELENTLKQYGASAVTGYIQPITDLFGANMHSGYYHSADVEKFGFHFRFDIVAMAAAVTDNQKTYTLNTPAGFTPATVQTATVFGGAAGEVTDPHTGSTYRAPADGLINTTYLPLAVPQVTIGNIYGTQATIRYITLPKMSGDKIPDITLWGVGARHSISQYLPTVPLDLAAGIYFNSFTFGDLIDFKGVAINAQASKSFSVLTIYGGLQWEKSSMSLKYTSADATNFPVDITMDGVNAFRFTAGLNIGLGPLHLFADANMGSITAFSGGIGFGN